MPSSPEMSEALAVFNEQLQSMQTRLSAMSALHTRLENDGATPLPPGATLTLHQDLLTSAFQELETSSEELRVASEEMNAQEEQLAEAANSVEAWRLHYQHLFEFAPEAYLVTDFEGRILEANRRAALLLNVVRLPPDYLLGKPLVNYVAASGRGAVRASLRRLSQVSSTGVSSTGVSSTGVSSTGVAVTEPRREEWRLVLRPPLRALLEVFATVEVVPDAAGQPQALRWLLRDATASQAAEDERYHFLLDTLEDYAVFSVDLDGDIFSWNRGAERVLGYARAEAVGLPFARLFTAQDQRAGVPAQEMKRATLQGRTDDDGWHVRQDGTQFWASGVLNAMQDAAGNLRGFVKVMRDLTAQKTAEERLAADYAHEHTIAETLQRALLPEIAADAFDGLEVVTRYESAWQEARVGGDFSDAFALGDGSVAVAVGDVTGKGLRAAVHTAAVRNALRAFLREYPSAPIALTRLSSFIADNIALDDPGDDPGDSLAAYVALSVAVIAPQTGEVTMAVAGMEPPLLIRRDGRAEVMTVEGALLGVATGQPYQSGTATLAPGERLLLVTDGVTEARRGREFLEVSGLSRIVEEIERQGAHLSLRRRCLPAPRAKTRKPGKINASGRRQSNDPHD